MPEEQKPTGIVLVADGIDDCLDTTLKEALAPTDYALMHVRNAVEAVATLELLKSSIALAVIGANFPTTNGFDLIGRLVMRDQPSPVKIIMTTVHEQPSPQLVRELGGYAVVSRSTPPEEWRATIVNLLSGTPGRRF